MCLRGAQNFLLSFKISQKYISQICSVHHRPVAMRWLLLLLCIALVHTQRNIETLILVPTEIRFSLLQYHQPDKLDRWQTIREKKMSYFMYGNFYFYLAYRNIAIAILLTFLTVRSGCRQAWTCTHVLFVCAHEILVRCTEDKKSKSVHRFQSMCQINEIFPFYWPNINKKKQI